MSKSFKKVVACLLAVLMVMFSVPFSAFAAATPETPDIQLQFGTLFNSYGDNADAWVDNFTDGSITTSGRGANPDLTASGLGGPILVANTKLDSANAKLSVNSLTIEAADTANYENTDLNPLAADYNLKAGDAFTVTVLLDGCSTSYIATAEVSYSDNMVPLYFTESGSGNKYKSEMGTEAQGLDPESCVWGKTAIPDYDPQSLYNDINADEIGSETRTDYNGENYMYAETVATVSAADVSEITNADAPDLANEDGTFGNTYANRFVLATFAFVLTEDISADNPLQFWIHNGGTDAHGISDQGKDMFTGFSEGGYLATKDNTDSSAYVTYVTNKFESIDNQFNGEENAGSKKMTFMGVNQNVQSAHVHDFTGATPVWTWADDNSSATATITCTADGCDESDGYQLSATDNDIATTVKTAGNCTTKGVNTLTAEVTLNGTNVSTTKDVEGEIDANNHDYVSVVTNPTCTEQGYTTYTCSRCGDSYKADYTDPTGHKLTPHAEVPATCTEAGTAAYWECTVCHKLFSDAEATNEIEEPVVIPAKQHAYEISAINWDTLNTETGKVDATYVCANDASHTKTENVQTTFVVTQQQTETLPEITTYTYSVGEFNDSKEVQTKAPAGHTHNLTPYAAVPATCTEDGSEAYWVCSGCGKMFSDAEATNEISNPIVIPAPGHTPGQVVIENEVEATKTTDGSYDKVVYCTECNTELSRETVVVPATGIIVTVPKYSVGEITLNGEALDGTKANETAVKYGSTYTLEVTDGTDYFKGWEMNGKIVSEKTTFSSVAYSDITVTPVFEVPDATKMTVVFYDKFGNKVKEYKDLTAEQYQATIASDGIPTAQSYPSSRFVEWDTAEADILALTESKTIWAVYEDVESEQKYTVTVRDAEGADITDNAATFPAGVTKDAVPYDTKVTVTNENAKGWAIDGVTVSTEDTYTFFVGADVTVTMLTDVEAEPTTTIIGANRLTDPSYRYNIMATRNVPAGYELVDYGFVYGKNLTDADLVLENEGKAGTGTNSGNVKVARAATKNTASNEFALNYGIKTAGNQVTVKSFIVVKNAAGVQVVYSDMFSYDS